VKMEMIMAIDRTPLWQTEFPDYPIADMPAIPDGFEDTSWHNDACPSFTHPDSRMVLWVDYADPAQREISGPRFAISQADIDGLIENVLLTTEDWNDVLKFLER
jgi:hypothetical protein